MDCFIWLVYFRRKFSFWKIKSSNWTMDFARMKNWVLFNYSFLLLNVATCCELSGQRHHKSSSLLLENSPERRISEKRINTKQITGLYCWEFNFVAENWWEFAWWRRVTDGVFSPPIDSFSCSVKLRIPFNRVRDQIGIYSQISIYF